jgi:hypothetical protein
MREGAGEIELAREEISERENENVSFLNAIESGQATKEL